MDKSSRASELLAKWRTRLGLSQVAASERIGLSQAHYSKYERGRHRPGRQHAVRIFDGTGGTVPIHAWDEAPISRTRASERRAS